jgi:ABC-2 type transport system permease protein
MSAPENRQDLASFRSVYLVARREFVIRLRSRVYRIGTALMVLLLIGYVVLQTRVLNNRTSVTTVGFTSSAQILAQPLKGAARGLGQITIQHIASQAVGERLVRSGHLDVLVSGSPLSPKVLAKSQLNTALQAALTGLVKQESLAAQLAAHGLNPRAVATVVSGATIHVHILTPASRQRTQQAIMGVIVAIVLFVSLQIYGIQVAQGVAEEKESRNVEGRGASSSSVACAHLRARSYP